MGPAISEHFGWQFLAACDIPDRRNDLVAPPFDRATARKIPA